jgi:hypothetical protein
MFKVYSREQMSITTDSLPCFCGQGKREIPTGDLRLHLVSSSSPIDKQANTSVEFPGSSTPVTIP